MKQVLMDIAKAIVDTPEAVEVLEKDGGDTVLLELKVASGDMGKVIGKRGKIANAIRTVVKAAATRDNKRVVVSIASDAE